MLEIVRSIEQLVANRVLKLRSRDLVHQSWDMIQQGRRLDRRRPPAS